MGQTTTATGWIWVRDITRYQWMIFLIAWFGWSLDNTDFNLFSLVLRPAITDLLGGSPTQADIGRVGGPAKHDRTTRLGIRRFRFRHRR